MNSENNFLTLLEDICDLLSDFDDLYYTYLLSYFNSPKKFVIMSDKEKAKVLVALITKFLEGELVEVEEE